jgi:outer membrane lipoprotein-sorting protein
MRFLFAFLLVTLVPKAQALEDIFRWQSLAGEFNQILIDSTQGSRVESNGSFRILRPGYATWVVNQPDPEEFHLSPEGLWHFDPWLEVASFHGAEALEAASAIALLSGDIEALREDYEISASAGTVRLLARDDQGQIEYIELFLDQNTIPKHMVIRNTVSSKP